MIGPNMFRTVYGDIGSFQEKCHLIRYYQIPRKNLAAAIDLMGEIDALSDKISLAGVVPVAHQEMGIIMGIYRFSSMADVGMSIDEIGLSEAFQKLVDKANTLGSLTSAHMNIIL